MAYFAARSGQGKPRYKFGPPLPPRFARGGCAEASASTSPRARVTQTPATFRHPGFTSVHPKTPSPLPRPPAPHCNVGHCPELDATARAPNTEWGRGVCVCFGHTGDAFASALFVVCFAFEFRFLGTHLFLRVFRHTEDAPSESARARFTVFSFRKWATLKMEESKNLKNRHGSRNPTSSSLVVAPSDTFGDSGFRAATARFTVISFRK